MTDALYEIARSIMLCQRCDRYAVRQKAVPGEGRIRAPILFVGEAPGWREDSTGRPFTHKSGKKLDEWLEKSDLSREDLYITNVLRCYGGKEVPFPDDNERDGPVDRCLPFLKREYKCVKPYAIIVAGRRALHHFVLSGAIGNSNPFGAWAGKILRRRDRFGETRIGVIWHPAKILRQWSPIDENASLQVLERIGDYVRARQQNKPAPITDLVDIRPAGQPRFQQRMRVFDLGVSASEDNADVT